jgi:hypothetical protein
MFDCDDAGVDGMKAAMWLLAERKLDVRLAWSPEMHGKQFVGKQPEMLSQRELELTLS